MWGRAQFDFQKSHLCKSWTGDRQDPVPCQCHVSLKQFHIPACIPDQELNMAPDLFIISLGEGGACGGLWTASRGEEHGLGTNHTEGAGCGHEVRRLSEPTCCLKNLGMKEKGAEGFLNLSPCLSQVNPFWLMRLACAEHLARCFSGWSPVGVITQSWEGGSIREPRGQNVLP